MCSTTVYCTKCGGKLRPVYQCEKCASESMESAPSTSTNAQIMPLLCPWANGGECPNVNIKCGECTRDTLLSQRKDYAVISQQH